MYVHFYTCICIYNVLGVNQHKIHICFRRLHLIVIIYITGLFVKNMQLSQIATNKFQIFISASFLAVYISIVCNWILAVHLLLAAKTSHIYFSLEYKIFCYSVQLPTVESWAQQLYVLPIKDTGKFCNQMG